MVVKTTCLGGLIRGVTISDGCYIDALTKNGITIGKHSIVSAGAVVNKDVEPFSIVGGAPAKLIRKRN